MDFQVPQFIERQPRIIWKITFKQFLFLCLVGGFLAFLHLKLASRVLFWLIFLLLAPLSLALVFLRIQGKAFGFFILNFFSFLIKPKLYLWKRKTAPPKFLMKKEIKPKEKEEKLPSLKIAEKSRLKRIATRVETGV